MAAPSCPECGGTRWVRYFSEMKDGTFEEAFRLCPCNREPQTRSERHREESERRLPRESRLAQQIEEPQIGEPKRLQMEIELRCQRPFRGRFFARWEWD